MENDLEMKDAYLQELGEALKGYKDDLSIITILLDEHGSRGLTNTSCPSDFIQFISYLANYLAELTGKDLNKILELFEDEEVLH